MYRIFTVLLFIGLLNCKEAPKMAKSETKPSQPIMDEVKNNYPEAFAKVMEAHGGIENWKSKRTLTFDISKPGAKENHTIDLHSRRDKIDILDISMGFDGKEIWLLDEKNKYKGNAAVYHNLMFYFYAMPFVLADPGIKYETTEDLVYEGKSYPGFHITYDDGIGASPKDDYYLHYDPETFQMAWLGYTFTYGSNAKSDDVRWMRYNDWTKVDDVLLPKSITWHNYDGRKIKEAKDPVLFEHISLDKSSKPDAFYAVPKNAKVVLKQ